jgi:hypothetical protein
MILSFSSLVVAGCTQEALTAPSMATEVVAQGGVALPSAPGQESGTITLAPLGGALKEQCKLRVSLKNLYNVLTSEVDGYYMYVNPVGYQSDFISPSARGTYRGTVDYVVASGGYTSIELNYWSGTSFPYGDRVIATISAGVITPAAGFVIQNRCW